MTIVANPLLLWIWIEPVRYRRDLPRDLGEHLVTDLADLCERAGIPLRATVPPRTIYVRSHTEQIRTPSADVIGVPESVLYSRRAALRALEALAHSFHDHGARACVCGRGLFTTLS